MLEILREATKQGRWAEMALSILAEPRPPADFQEKFGTYWIEAGHRIREQIGDDRLLVQVLRCLLPPYEGGSQTLYRGENIERFEAGQVGLAWCLDVAVAKMFASGLNAIPSGGVLLVGTFESAAIVSGPNAHSLYLGENQFTIDPALCASIQALERFSPCT